MIDRRFFLLAGAALASGCLAQAPQPGNQVTTREPDFGPILSRLGASARLGVFALDTGSGGSVTHDEASRFTMCSTFKLPLAAAILAEVEAGRLGLDQEIAFTRADMVNNSPRVEAALACGRMSIEQLCAAIIEVSDNAGANLLMARIGGPAALTAFARRCGDSVTRFDRMEPALNYGAQGDERDTTTPTAMVGLMRAMLVGDVLTAESRARLTGWMGGAVTGLDRLRAGLSGGWRTGDKTGTAGNFNNDLAIAQPPRRAPILIASFVDAPASDAAGRNAAHAAVARVVATALG